MRTTMVVLLGLVVVASLEGIFYALRFLAEKRSAELKRRLRLLGDAPDDADLGLLRAERYAASPALAGFVRRLPGAPALDRLLMEADSPLSVAQLLAWSAAAGATALALLLAIGAGAAPALAIGLLAAAVPTALVWSARIKRSEKLSEQLPDALDMMSRSLRAGHSLSAAFRLVASEMPAPASVEFGRAYEEQKLGLAVDEAVVNMTGRCPLNRDLKIFAVSLTVQKETGGNLAEILDNIAETIRERYRFYGKLAALTAEGRTSGLVLGSLPVAMMLFLAVANPKYLTRLFDNPIGQMILLYAIVSWVLGGLWMKRMAKVEY